MREIALLLLVAPFGLLVVLNAGLAKAPPLEITAVPVEIVVPVPTVPGTRSIIDVARSWLGVPYLWGGCTRRGVDCSCFVRNVLGVFGINAPRTTGEQIRWAQPVGREQIDVGDLVFFNNTCTGCGPNPTHVGLAIGGGMMIHAGDPVQIQPIFGRLEFAGAGRPR